MLIEPDIELTVDEDIVLCSWARKNFQRLMR